MCTHPPPIIFMSNGESMRSTCPFARCAPHLRSDSRSVNLNVSNMQTPTNTGTLKSSQCSFRTIRTRHSQQVFPSSESFFENGTEYTLDLLIPPSFPVSPACAYNTRPAVAVVQHTCFVQTISTIHHLPQISKNSPASSSLHLSL